METSSLPNCTLQETSNEKIEKDTTTKYVPMGFPKEESKYSNPACLSLLICSTLGVAAILSVKELSKRGLQPSQGLARSRGSHGGPAEVVRASAMEGNGSDHEILPNSLIQAARQALT